MRPLYPSSMVMAIANGGANIQRSKYNNNVHRPCI